MISTAPSPSCAFHPTLMLERLLLGDLLEILLDAPGRQRDRWLLATLDMLLTTVRPRLVPAVYLPSLTAESLPNPQRRFGSDLPVSSEKLQRLRDRIVHRASYEILANDLKAELREVFNCDELEPRPVVA
jgi:hypothetical protein